MISLKEVTKKNWLDVVRLYSAEDQKNRIFERDIASNCLSLTQASIEGGWTTRAIYDDETLVGFTMFGYSEEFSGYELCRFMIHYTYQGKGLGKKAILLILEEMKNQYQCEEIFLSFHPENTKAQKLYESVGFNDTGRVVSQFVDELIYSYKC